MLFARTGRFLDQYRTALFILSPRRRAGRSTRQTPAVAAYQLHWMGRNGWENNVVDSHTITHNLAAHLILPPGAGETDGGSGAGSAGSVGSGGAAPVPAIERPTLYAVGGQCFERPFKMEERDGWSPTHRSGVHLLKATSFEDLFLRRWFPYRRNDHIRTSPVLSGKHPGCVERRWGKAWHAKPCRLST